MKIRVALVYCICSFGSVFIATGLVAQDTLKQAMAIRPVHEVEIDNPTEEELAKCRVERAAEVLNIPGYIVLDPSGRKLRQFLDVDQDKELDTWQFFQNGTEVYRDLDTNHDKKKDQARWLGTAGTRWGIDKDQNGKIDSWQNISAEEVAAEIFEAIKANDAERFRAVLISPAEIKSLELKSDLAESLTGKTAQSSADFAKAAAAFKSITKTSEFVHFGSSTPFLLSNDFEKDGNKADVVFYDHASAVFSEGKTFSQIALGTLIKVGDGWRAVELPVMMEEGKIVSNGGVLLPNAIAQDTPKVDGNNEKIAKLFDDFEAIEKRLKDAKPSKETEELEKSRANILYQLVLVSTGDENRKNWIRQMADTIAASYEGDRFDTALDVLRNSANQLKKNGIVKDVDYIEWRAIMARFSKLSEGDGKQRSEASEKFQSDLEQFIKDYPESEFAAEGLMQLALYAEVNASDEAGLKKAVNFYQQVETKFPSSPSARRAKGARTRLNSVGESVAFKGKTSNNQDFDLSNPALRGKVVVIHYWASWCDVCIGDFEELERLAAKYKDDLVLVGVNLDEDVKQMTDYLKKNPGYKWTQLYASGGISESPLAEQLGVSTLPLTLVIDKEGKVSETGLSAKELDRSIQRLTK